MTGLSRRLAGEGLGTALLLATVVGSGIMADRLSGGNQAIALLANTIATAAALVALILTFGPVSGAHFNPDNKMHGSKNPKGPHVGDMNNFMVRPDGTSTQTVTNQHASLAADGTHTLFDPNGTSLVIHAKPDDMKTDPSGNSGDRIACGVIEGTPAQ